MVLLTTLNNNAYFHRHNYTSIFNFEIHRQSNYWTAAITQRMHTCTLLNMFACVCRSKQRLHYCQWIQLPAYNQYTIKQLLLNHVGMQYTFLSARQPTSLFSVKQCHYNGFTKCFQFDYVRMALMLLPESP